MNYYTVQECCEQTINALEDIRLAFNKLTLKLMDMFPEVTVTNYKCNCGCNLVILEHTESEIIYVCINCDKIYKAKKNRVLGRFN